MLAAFSDSRDLKWKIQLGVERLLSLASIMHVGKRIVWKCEEGFTTVANVVN